MNERLVADIQATRKVLQEFGWTREWDRIPLCHLKGGPCCLITAALRAAPGYQDAVITHLRETLRLREDSLVKWNDAPERTFDDVLALLDEAEAEAANQ